LYNRRCINDRPAKLLYEEINELLESGMFTLNGKLRGVPDEKLVSRLVELWSFYFGTVIPYFEGVFLPLQIHNSTTQQNHTSIRRLVLMSFRDHVILPMGNRVEGILYIYIFEMFYMYILIFSLTKTLFFF